MIFANALLVVMNIITNKQTILFVELRKDSLSATPPHTKCKISHNYNIF